MDKPKEVDELRIYVEEIAETLDAAGNPPRSTHEIVLPKCWVYDIPCDWWVYPFIPSADFEVCQEAWELAEFEVKLFGYSVRYDPDAHALDILPKQVEDPLPFE